MEPRLYLLSLPPSIRPTHNADLPIFFQVYACGYAISSPRYTLSLLGQLRWSKASQRIDFKLVVLTYGMSSPSGTRLCR